MIIKMQRHSQKSLPTSEGRAFHRCEELLPVLQLHAWNSALQDQRWLSVHNSKTVFITHVVELKRLPNLILL